MPQNYPFQNSLLFSTCACSIMSTFATPWTAGRQVPLVYGIFPGKATGMGCHFVLQRIFLTQGSNVHLLYHLLGRFFITEPLGKPQVYFYKIFSLPEEESPHL